MMEIFPAIDLRGGRVVRLLRGDYAQMTVYSESPADVARDFEACGARFLHAVDLDGAKSGNSDNEQTLRDLVRCTGLKVEIGGGIRSEETIQRYLDCGAFRVILGTIAVRDPDFTARMLARYGRQIAIGVDLREGRVSVSGWREDSGLDGTAFIESLRDQGCRALICTDIAKDGMLEGTNRGLYRSLMEQFPEMDITASGGVSTLEDVTVLRDMGLYGAIIGRAYYEGTISLRTAIEVCA